MTISTLPTPFTLQRGSTYFFGVIANLAELDVGFWFEPIELQSHGLRLHNPNSNYGDFESPHFAGSGAATVGLRLVGSDVSPTPEPASLILFGSGLIGLVAVKRRRPTVR